MFFVVEVPSCPYLWSSFFTYGDALDYYLSCPDDALLKEVYYA